MVYFYICFDRPEPQLPRLPPPAASHLASLSPSPLSALPSCQRRLNLTQVRGGASTSLSLLFLLPLPHSFHPQNGHFVLVSPSVARRPSTPHRSHARARPSGVGEWMGKSIKLILVRRRWTDRPTGTEAIRRRRCARSFWNQREGQRISPAYGGDIF